ncbi:hypothetical protein OPV22_026424 [Ensete ventricosum]|uniref:Thioredoxin domain-containing protein n=1 Tax=Ensete ventricosum TaxID=4639 RepID=A0AAV8P8H6_ENSVE|nr:hypothetical protein OPV22_026424 [Ensete ventricosum]
MGSTGSAPTNSRLILGRGAPLLFRQDSVLELDPLQLQPPSNPACPNRTSSWVLASGCNCCPRHAACYLWVPGSWGLGRINENGYGFSCPNKPPEGCNPQAVVLRSSIPLHKKVSHALTSQFLPVDDNGVPVAADSNSDTGKGMSSGGCLSALVDRGSRRIDLYVLIIKARCCRQFSTIFSGKSAFHFFSLFFPKFYFPAVAGELLVCTGLSRQMGNCMRKNVGSSGNEDEVDFRGGNVHVITSKSDWEQKIAEANKDGKIVVANFSATWCGPCRTVAPVYRELSEKYRSLIFLTIDVDNLMDFCLSLRRKYSRLLD